MAVHLIPDDGAPHAETSECGCGPAVQVYGQITYVHRVCGGDEHGDAGRRRDARPGQAGQGDAGDGSLNS